MTKHELIQAGRLHLIYENADAILTDTSGNIAVEAITILRRAQHAFTCLTGRLPSQVSRVDLNTESPADWTKTI